MIPKTIRMAWLLALILPIATAQGYPGRGGGMRGGGGGGMRGGGFGGAGGGMRGGGGFSRSPAISAPRPSPSPRPAPGGANLGGGVRPATRPAGPQVGAGRPSTLPGRAPVGGDRPSTLPSGPQIGAGRPSTLPSRPQVGGERPTTLPSGPIAGNRPGGVPGPGNRPGIDGRPGVGPPGIAGRPGIGDNLGNRPVIGSGNTINRGDININAGRQNNLVGNRVDPGYGVRPPGYDPWRGAYAAYHRGWVNGYWHGYHTNPNWSWGSFAVGAATGVAAWGLGSSLYSWGYMPYANPYSAAAAPVVVEQPVTVVGAQPAPVAAPYDYSQPINTQAPPPEPTVADRATASFDAAREAFRAGDYAKALGLTDQALSDLPNDATLHEFRALCLFARQQYEAAAAPLYAVLSVGPGWDWTTLVGLYPGVEVYTQQLRALEAYVKASPKSPAGHFVLAYHYLTQDHPDAAVNQLKQVVSLAPADSLSAQLIKQLTGGAEPTAEAPAAPPGSPTGVAPGPQGELAGNWSASPAPDTTINLSIRDDGAFAWKVTSKGKTQDITGDWSLTNGVLTLAQDNQGGALVGNMTWQEKNRFTFRAIGTGPGDAGLTFTR